MYNPFVFRQAMQPKSHATPQMQRAGGGEEH